MIIGGVFLDPVMGYIEPAAPSSDGGYRSFTMFWIGGLAALAGGAVGNPWHYYAQMRRMST